MKQKLTDERSCTFIPKRFTPAAKTDAVAYTRGRSPVERLAGACITIVLALLLPHFAAAVDVTLAWDANTESDLAGYTIFFDSDSGDPYGGAFGSATSPVDIPIASLSSAELPRYPLTNLPSCDGLVYFAAKAYDTSANYSDYSDEIYGMFVQRPNVTIAAVGDSSINVAWDALPLGDNGSVEHYQIHYGLTEGGPYDGTGADQGSSPVVIAASALADPAHPSLVLTGLASNNTYYVKVSAHCFTGACDPSLYEGCADSTELSESLDTTIADAGHADVVVADNTSSPDSVVTSDATQPDHASVDTALADTHVMDSAQADMHAADTTTIADAFVADGSAADTATADAASADIVTADAQNDAGGPPSVGSGCACAQAANTGHAGAYLGLALLVWLRRLRR